MASKEEVKKEIVKSFTIHDLPEAERPRERLQKFGAEALSAQELLALIIGRGIPGKSVINIAQELLNKFKNINSISQATIEQLREIGGIDLAKAAQIKACFELGKRSELEPEFKDVEIKNPDVLVKMIRASIKDKAKEHFKLVLLNSRNKVIGISDVSIGTLTANLVHPREVFKEAIIHNAANIILVHNHPSGNPEPSEDDVKITERLINAGKLLDINVLDHVIIGHDSFISLKDKGVIKEE